MLDILLHYLCECGKIGCRNTIEYTEQSQIDFDAYCYQRDEYCLISKSCKRATEISRNKIAIEGDDYIIFEEG